jgi:uncharacterized protein (DUF4415 family)
MNKRPVTQKLVNENPEWSAQDVATAQTFSGLHPSLQTTLRGRPKAASVKERLTIRIEPEVLARWRASGPGWQTRAAALLAAKAPK